MKIRHIVNKCTSTWRHANNDVVDIIVGWQEKQSLHRNCREILLNPTPACHVTVNLFLSIARVHRTTGSSFNHRIKAWLILYQSRWMESADLFWRMQSVSGCRRNIRTSTDRIAALDNLGSSNQKWRNKVVTESRIKMKRILTKAPPNLSILYRWGRQFERCSFMILVPFWSPPPCFEKGFTENTNEHRYISNISSSNGSHPVVSKWFKIPNYYCLTAIQKAQRIAPPIGACGDSILWKTHLWAVIGNTWYFGILDFQKKSIHFDICVALLEPHWVRGPGSEYEYESKYKPVSRRHQQAKPLTATIYNGTAADAVSETQAM